MSQVIYSRESLLLLALSLPKKYVIKAAAEASKIGREGPKKYVNRSRNNN